MKTTLKKEPGRSCPRLDTGAAVRADKAVRAPDPRNAELDGLDLMSACLIRHLSEFHASRRETINPTGNAEQVFECHRILAYPVTVRWGHATDG